MAIPKTIRRQLDFSAGQVDAAAERRTDLKIVNAGLKRAINCAPLSTGGIERRPGREVRYFDDGPSVHGIIRAADGAVFDIGFYDQAFIVRDIGGGIIDTVTGCPWTAGTRFELQWAASDLQVFVTHESFEPQVLSFDQASGSWSIDALGFTRDGNGRYKVPSLRFDNFGATIGVSGRTGTVLLRGWAGYQHFGSVNIFRPTMVGTVLTWAGKQILLTTYLNPSSMYGTVLEELPPTFLVQLDASESGGWRVGEIVEGGDSGTIGEVIEVYGTGDHFLTILTTNNYNGFDNGEPLIGLTGRGEVSGQTEVVGGSSIQWSEQFMSADRGWPRSVTVAYRRLILADFPQRPDAVLASRIDTPNDFEIGAAADAAFLEFLPKKARAVHVVSGSDLFVLSDAGPYYVPVSPSNPLAPGNIVFQLISTDAASTVRPVAFGTGVLFVSIDGKRVLAIVTTGQTAQPYLVQSLTDFHRDLFGTILALAYSDGTADVPGRRAYVVNSDGTVVVGRYGEGEDYVGWFPWRGQGAVSSIAAGFGSVIFETEYATGGGATSVFVGEEMSLATYLDGTITLTTSDSWQDSTGEAWKTSTGDAWQADTGLILPFAGAGLVGWGDGFFLGEVNVDNDGIADIDSGDFDEVTVGWAFTPEVQPFVPMIDEGQDNQQGLRPRKVARVGVTVRDTQTFAADGCEFAGYVTGDNQEAPRPLRNDTFRYRQLGRSFDPVVEISQPTPGAFKLIELALEVTV